MQSTNDYSVEEKAKVTAAAAQATLEAALTAFTQTYSTSDHTHAAVTAINPATYGSGTAGFTDGTMAAAIHAECLALRADIVNVKSVLTALIDDLQSLGIVK